MNFSNIDLNNIKTPCYCYDMELLDNTLREVAKASSIDRRFSVHYAVKANARPELLELISSHGFGADCVSGWEIEAAVKHGFPAEKVVFAGVGKSDREIITALRLDIHSFNVESMPEIEVISQLAQKEGHVAHIAIRVNPQIDAHTHKYITTGLSENKFGISLEQLDEAISLALDLPGIEIDGLHFHIGSQITELDCYRLLCDRINDLVARYKARGISFKSINVGGGLGVDYKNPDANPIPDFKAYFDLFARHLDLDKNVEIHFELGRSIVAQCGDLLTRVLFVKKTPTRNFAIVDAGMTDLIRPALYQAHHKIEAVGLSSDHTEIYDVVGPICESSDVFGRDERLPALHRGDLIAIRTAGAYGEVMASNYNLRPLPSALLIKP